MAQLSASRISRGESCRGTRPEETILLFNIVRDILKGIAFLGMVKSLVWRSIRLSWILQKIKLNIYL